MKLRIYVASSWKNPYQPFVVLRLREAGHEVYDFKDPANAFNWKDVLPGRHYQSWTATEYAEALQHPLAKRGFMTDMNALDNADLVVMVMPCGRSAAYEYGYWRGKMQRNGILVIPQGEQFEPELMYAGSAIVNELPRLIIEVGHFKERLEQQISQAIQKEDERDLQRRIHESAKIRPHHNED